MKQFVIIYLPWVLSGITIWMNILAGNLHKNAWFIGLFGQVLWLIWIVLSENWGFIPLNITLWIIYFRNHLKWNRK